MILLWRLARSLQLGLDHFYDFIEEAPVSKQALSKARMGLNPEFVRKFAISLTHQGDYKADGRKQIAKAVENHGDINVFLSIAYHRGGGESTYPENVAEG